MPMGSKHEETGWLQEEGGRLLLLCDEGGTWHLDAPSRFKKLIGAKVQVVGRRAEFDLLEVTIIHRL